MSVRKNRVLSVFKLGAAMGLFVLGVSASGCGTEDDFDLSSLPEVTEDDKADKTGNPLVWIRPSAFKLYCFRQPCADKQVVEVNGGATRLVYKYDWRSLRLTKAEQEDAEKNAGSMLLYGRFTTVKVSGEDMAVLQMTRANKPVSTTSSDQPTNDSYLVTKTPSPASCTTPPCPLLEGTLLNPKGTVAPNLWQGLDTSRLGLNKTDEGALLDDLKAGKAYVSVSGVSKDTARISQAFRPLK
jgi:hypothetical protein